MTYTIVTLLHEQQLAYVQTPKVATTTMFNVMHGIAGVPGKGGKPREEARDPEIAKALQGKGLERRALRAVELQGLQTEYAEYYWFCIARNPINRIVSSYNSKLQRYAKTFAKGIYLRSRLATLGDGLKTLDDSRNTSRQVARRISFDDMLKGLKKNGVSFDQHFEEQAVLTAQSSLTYDQILKLETLDDDLASLASRTGVGPIEAVRKAKWNSSLQTGLTVADLTRRHMEQIVDLYRQDFEVFGYSLPE
ncbi:sulfotransferase family 2 domain-containing protein [Shimia sediminis]|uniref:sulfotransferase family 2 domain-containing protein n=1 Tax=Shimia sediminis TaxID=2497945 RepID=UPI000F8ED98C|nr:sulfotransferase family 2 domain-containing protein [Shimia sediminis]